MLSITYVETRWFSLFCISHCHNESTLCLEKVHTAKRVNFFETQCRTCSRYQAICGVLYTTWTVADERCWTGSTNRRPASQQFRVRRSSTANKVLRKVFEFLRAVGITRPADDKEAGHDHQSSAVCRNRSGQETAAKQQPNNARGQTDRHTHKTDTRAQCSQYFALLLGRVISLTNCCSTDSEMPHRCCHLPNKIENSMRMPDIPL